jgi:hypothetical protein
MRAPTATSIGLSSSLDGGQRRFPVQLSVATLDDDIMVLDPTPLSQPVDECLPPQIDERGASRYV